MAEPYGTTIREARLRQTMTQNRLADLAGISRRHLAELEKGANISVEVLIAIMRALGINDIDLGEGLTAHDGSTDVSGARLLPIADEMEREGERVILLAKNIRAFVAPKTESPKRSSALGDAVNDEAAELVDMMLQFVRNAGAIPDPKTIEELERGVSKVLSRSSTA